MPATGGIDLCVQALDTMTMEPEAVSQHACASKSVGGSVRGGVGGREGGGGGGGGNFASIDIVPATHGPRVLDDPIRNFGSVAEALKHPGMCHCVV